MTNQADWIKALTFAALPGAQSVELTRTSKVEDGTPTVSYALRSYDQDGAVIGDDRDYDVLKAAMGPLERLSEAREADFSMRLDLTSKALKQNAL